MQRTSKRISDSLRAAILAAHEDGTSYYALARQAGVQHGQISRFARERELTTRSVDALAHVLGLRLVGRRHNGRQPSAMIHAARQRLADQIAVLATEQRPPCPY